MLAAGVIGAFQIGKLPAALPLLRAELGLDLVAAGWVISAITAVGVVTGIIWGVYSDRLGHRRILLGGMALIASGSLAGGYAWDAGSMLATRILEGAGYIAVVTAAPALLSPLTTPRDRSIAYGVWSFYFPFGLAGMVILSPPILAVVSWRDMWLLNAVIALAALAAVAVATRGVGGGGQGATRTRGGVLQTLAAPGPHVLGICFAAYSLIHLSVVAFLPTFLIERRGVELEEAALMTAFVMLMNAPGCLLGGWLLRVRVPAWLVMAGGYAGMLICAFGVFSETIPAELRYVMAALLPFCGGVIPPAVLDRVPRHAASPALIATTIGWVIQVVSLGQLLGPPALAALVAGAESWQAAVPLTAGAAVVGLLAAGALWALERGD